MTSKVRTVGEIEVQRAMLAQLRKQGAVSLDTLNYGPPKVVEEWLTEWCYQSGSHRPLRGTGARMKDEWVRFALNLLGLHRLQPIQEDLLMVTLTFRDFDGNAPGIKKVRKNVDSWLSRIKRVSDRGFVAAERSPAERLHAHGMLRIRHGTDLGVAAARMAGQWNAGYIRVEVARNIDHAVRYMVKYCLEGMVSDEGDFWAINAGSSYQERLS